MNSLQEKVKAKFKIAVNILQFYKYYFLRTNATLPLYDKCVVIDIKNIMLERVYAHILFSMQENSYKIFMINNLKVIANMTEYAKEIASLPNLTIVDRVDNIENNCLYIYDHDIAVDNRFRKVKISESVLTDDNSQFLNIMPFPMIPRHYYSGNYRIVSKLRELHRDVKMYFSGNSNKESYNHPIYENFLKKLSRTTMINIVKKYLDSNEIEVIKGYIDDKNGYKNKLILSEWSRDSGGVVNIQGRTSNEDWFEQLARSDFFLACPGYVQPLCHNIVEAMSVGTIPLTEYSEYLNPHLVDGVNCVVFSGEIDLIAKIRMILSMTDKEINFMRENVIDYYEKHLSPKAVCLFLEESANNKRGVDIITSSNYQKLWDTNVLLLN